MGQRGVGHDGVGQDLWDAEQYLRNAGPRRRPGAELLARIPLESPADGVDLGCGTAELTVAALSRWPDLRMTGVDSSADMLDRARPHERLELVERDVVDWASERPRQSLDLVFSNAALHWLDDHDALLPALLALLRPGGALAVQVPRNHHEPSHRLLAQVARRGPWSTRLEPRLREFPVAEPSWYLRVLRQAGARTVDVWSTTYEQVLSGEDPVFDWVLGSTLRPLLPALDSEERRAFASRYANALAEAYPREPDGTTVFAFTRVFMVATT